MALSKIDVANMLTGIAPVANGGTASTTLVAAGLGKRPLSKPIIINGNMAVAQRGTSFAAIGDGVYSLDRYEASKNNDGAVTITQEALTSGNAYTDGFRTALKVDVTTADGTLAGTQRFLVQQIVEAQNLQSLKFGTANAEKLTLAFWVKATKTGTHIVRMFQYDDDRSVSIAYTVNTTNTWEKKVMNFPADTTGVIDNDNGPGIQIAWGVGAGASFQSGTLATAWAGNTSANDFVGQVNGLDSTSNNFHLTGVQLEVGEFSSTTLPPFQHETFGDNLARCQRYYYQVTGTGKGRFTNGNFFDENDGDVMVPFPCKMRAAYALSSSAVGDIIITSVSAEADCTAIALDTSLSLDAADVRFTVGSDIATIGHVSTMILKDSGSYLAFDAEL